MLTIPRFAKPIKRLHYITVPYTPTDLKSRCFYRTLDPFILSTIYKDNRVTRKNNLQ